MPFVPNLQTKYPFVQLCGSSEYDRDPEPYMSSCRDHLVPFLHLDLVRPSKHTPPICCYYHLSAWSPSSLRSSWRLPPPLLQICSASIRVRTGRSLWDTVVGSMGLLVSFVSCSDPGLRLDRSHDLCMARWISQSPQSHVCGATLIIAQYKNYTFANDFVGCLCRGERKEQAIGNMSMTESAGICSTCPTTPSRIKTDLSVSCGHSRSIYDFPLDRP
jgi:hypothetical protein